MKVSNKIIIDAFRKLKINYFYGNFLQQFLIICLNKLAMASSNLGNVTCEENVFTEIMDIIHDLNKSGKLKAKYKDVVKYLSSCDESWEDFSTLPHEFKMISLMSKDPDTLCEYLNTKFSQKTELGPKKIILDKPVEIGKY